jgi:hypothetical protein
VQLLAQAIEVRELSERILSLAYYAHDKFRRGHIHFGNTHAKTIEDFKAVSMNAMHSRMKITDAFYSNLKSDEIQERIGSLGKGNQQGGNAEVVDVLKEFLVWKKSGCG